MSNDYNGKKRSELPDSVFGIPQERKYPMPDEKHTRSAIKLFNHVEPKYEEQLAKAIIKNMKKYNIDGSVVGPNNRLRKYLPKDMIKESMLLEGLLKSDKDIYYNKDKFDSGEINLCFITGLSGSGKSTMGRNMTSDKVKHYEMDDVICNYSFSDDNLKEYGGLISSFFKGSGKSFRLVRNDNKHNDSVFNNHKNYEKEITQAFVKHAISYCKSHTNIKYVCDGIWIFMFIKPSQLKDCAVYIKGTSSIKSGYRALKRDIDEDKRNKMTTIQIFKHEFKRVKEDILYAGKNQKELRSFRSYFEKQYTNESVLCIPILENCSKKNIQIMKDIINDSGSEEFKGFRFANISYYKIEYDNDKPIGFGTVRTKLIDDNTIGYVSVLVLPEYRGKGYGTKITEDIIDWFKGERGIDFLEWWYKPDNDASRALANKAGFIEYIATDEDQWKRTYMKNESSLLSESDSSKRNPYQYTVIKFLNKKIKPFVLGNKEWRKRAKDIHLTLTFKIHDTVSRYIGVTILDGSQEYRDTDQARHLLKEIKSAIIDYSKHIQEMKLVKRVNLGDGDEGSIYFDLGFINMIIHRSLDAKVVGEQVEDIPTVNSSIYFEESTVSEYGTTGGTMVGSNQPDSIYIVNYMQNNAFSGYKEPKFGICKKGMKDLHVVGGKYNRFHYVSDLDKFKEEASDIHVYRFKGKPKNEFFDIIEEMKDDNDLDLYKLITGREIKDRSEIQFDGDFIEEECFFDTIDAIKACTEAGLLEASTDLHPVPILTETVQGRPYNYYRDLNGVFIQHEITGLRSKSYETLDDIPEAEKDIVKRISR